jgi:hypothetical protein
MGMMADLSIPGKLSPPLGLHTSLAGFSTVP